MTIEAVAVVGGRLDTLRKASTLGLRVVYLQHPHLFTPEHAALVHAALLTDYLDWDTCRPLVKAAGEAFGVAGVACTTELGLETAGRVNDLLGLGGNSWVVHSLLRDKLAMRAHLARAARAPGAGVAAACVPDPASLAGFAAAHGYPVIVKPARGVASIGVLRVDGPGDLAAAWRHIEQVRHQPRGNQGFGTVVVEEFIAEEYLDGPEYSVEALSFDGRHVVLGVTEKVTLPNFLELGHALPARLEPRVQAGVVEAVRAFLDCIGVRRGPSHTEIRLTAAGPRVIESHTRPGGDRIGEMVAAVYGVDQECYALGWPHGPLPELAGPPAARCAAATRFLLAAPGVVERIEGVEEVRAQSDVLLVDVAVGPGDEVPPLAWNWDRPGQVVVTADSTGAAIARAEALAAQICIVTRPGPRP